MVKSGLIMGAVMFVLALGVSLISPLCAPCIAVFVGLGAGYLACVFDKPLVSSDGLKKGAIAGAIAGGLGLIGQMIAAFVNTNAVTAEQINQILGQEFYNQQSLQMVQLGAGLCLGLFNILLMVGLGVAGAAIWNSMHGSKQMSTPPTYTPPAQ